MGAFQSRPVTTGTFNPSPQPELTELQVITQTDQPPQNQQLPIADGANPESTTQEIPSSGTYFGPKFVVDYSQFSTIDNGVGRTELARILWDEIWNVLSSGNNIAESQLSQFGNVFQQVRALNI
jgi:hypothetical protein